MNPYYDVEKLRDEVIYLHSLWHQGPPQPPITTTTTATHFPQPQYTSHDLRHHYPAPARTGSSLRVPSTSFKKKKNKKKKQKGRDRDNSARPDPEWPCPVRHDPDPSTGWAKPKTGPAPSSEVPQQEKERLAAVQMQQKACKAVKEFLSNWDNDDDCDGDGDGDDEDDDDDGVWEEIREFFVGLFLEDDELRGYYQRCFESGEFCCLVCGAIGKKNHKRFKDCVALIQHSMSILRTLKRGVHRGFGMALCKVLGWDADRLPTIVMKGQPLGLETSTPAEAEGEPNLNNLVSDGDGKDGSQSYESDDKAVSLEHGGVQVEEEPTKGIDQSTNNERDQDDHKLDIGVQNGGGAIYEGGT
ncbi:hypothetical protein VIGAN_06052600 [Vigna angularis var. angularis]|uniref:Uncharacterized protein n=1 Tax=Vigna angularis var. angularis TaxID=157739 RepID=A0A0S3S9U0_PHAAN|nr:uncharacterized protein LOC108338872 isoform X4 [Vigna angularis]BAT89549.1 hypothetical protein VIGAN_06052600 [Vigna angularis var. angularis]